MASGSRLACGEIARSRLVSSCRHSGIADPRDPTHGLVERLPAASLAAEECAPATRQTVVPTTALPSLFGPPALDQPPFLQAVQQRIQRRHTKVERARRARVDEFRDLVAVPRAVFEQRQNQQLGRALLPFTIVVVSAHTLDSNMFDYGIRMEREGVFCAH